MNLKKLTLFKLSMNSFYGPVNLNRILPKLILTLKQSDSRDKKSYGTKPWDKRYVIWVLKLKERNRGKVHRLMQSSALFINFSI